MKYISTTLKIALAICCAIIFSDLTVYCAKSAEQTSRAFPNEAIVVSSIDEIAAKDIVSSVQYAEVEQPKNSETRDSENACVCNQKKEDVLEKVTASKAELKKISKPKKYRVITINLPDDQDAETLEIAAGEDLTKVTTPKETKNEGGQEEPSLAEVSKDEEVKSDDEAAEIEEEEPKVEEKVTQKKANTKKGENKDKKRSKRDAKGRDTKGKKSNKKQQTRENDKRSKTKGTKGKK